MFEVLCMADLHFSANEHPVYILHVDDDPSSIELSRAILADMGDFVVDGACGVDVALEKLAVGGYDVVVSDFEMPQKDGLELLKKLRKQKNDIPFILFTGKGREEVAIKALNLGADAYHNKQGSPETVYGELAHSIKLVAGHRKTQREIEERDNRLKKIASQTPGMLYQFARRPDGTYCVPYSSEYILRIFGCAPHDVREDFSPIAKAIFSEDLGRVFDSIEYSATHLTPWECEYRVQLPGQPIRWLFGQSVPERLDDGSIIWSGYNADITERKKAEESLKESELKYKSIFSNSGVGIFRTRLDGSEILDFNQKFLEVFGWTREEMLGKPSVIHWADPGERQEMVRLLRSCGQVDNFECRMLNKRGEVRTCLTSLRLFSGSAILEGTITDISDRKKAEEELSEKYQALERVGESVGAGLAIISKDYEVFWANSTLRALGVARHKKCYQTFNRLDKVCPDCGVKKIFEQNVPLDIHEYRSVDSHGEVTWVELRVTPLKDKNGKVVSALELAVPITERKKIESTLKESEEKFRNLAEESPNMIFINKGGRVVYANKKCEEKMGYKRSEIYSPDFNFMSLIAPESVELLKASFSKHMLGEEVPPYEYVLVSKEGRKIEAEINSKLTSFEGEKAILGIITDITARKKAEEALRKSEESFRTIFEGAAEGILAADVKTRRFVFANSAMCILTGYPLRELVELCVEDILPKEDLFSMVGEFSKYAEGKSSNAVTLQILRKDGKTVYCQVTGRLYRFEETDCLVGFFTDITERKRAEDELKKSSLELGVLNEKLRVVGGLTRHDVNNKLMIAKANAYLLRKRVGDDVELGKYLGAIDAAINSSHEIFEIGRSYELLGSQELVEVDVGKSFDEAALLFRSLKEIKVTNQCRGLVVIADLMLSRVLYNLIGNSLKHGERVTEIRFYFEENNGVIKLIYEDNGVGISDENKAKLFSQGFTTGNGSGFGLKLIKEIVDIYGWTIAEVGKSGKGAKFVIAIPNLPQ